MASVKRTRRMEQAEQTRLRIVDAAGALFGERGYASTTIEAIAERADVAVETVYSRFRNKTGLLDAILGPAIRGVDGSVPLLEGPDIARIRECTDQREQLREIVHFSRTVLERTHHVHRILRTAAASDQNAAELERGDRRRRHTSQQAYIDMLLANGALREGLSASDARDTYAALASPETYAFLIDDCGWTPERFEDWLRESLTLVLLP